MVNVPWCLITEGISIYRKIGQKVKHLGKKGIWSPTHHQISFGFFWGTETGLVQGREQEIRSKYYPDWSYECSFRQMFPSSITSCDAGGERRRTGRAARRVARKTGTGREEGNDSASACCHPSHRWLAWDQLGSIRIKWVCWNVLNTW